MDTKKLYHKILGLKDPWYVDRVEMDEAGERIDIYVKHHNPIQAACPVCGKFYSIYDHAPDREIQHLNTCQLNTYVHMRFPRVECPEHGVKQIAVDLAEPNSHATFAFETHILELVSECSIAAVVRLVGLGWDATHGCVERAVARGFSRKAKRIPAFIAVDEKSIAKGHKYETLVSDHATGNVEFVADDNSQSSLESYYKQFNEQERSTVKAVTMDMWDPFIAATKAYIPDAEKKIVFDRFHVMQAVGKAVDNTRKDENAKLHEEGNDILKKTKYLWLYSPENFPRWRVPQFRELQMADLDVSRAWAIKENIRHLWDFHSETWARNYFKKWYFWATHSRLEHMKRAAQTLKDHFENIVTYIHHRITNALAESLNSKIEKIKRMACGYRNREHYKTAIYFHCGGLDMLPKPPATPQVRWRIA